MDNVQIARVCHEANRAYCLTLGDDSQLPWDEAPEWQKQSAINGVQFHLERNRMQYPAYPDPRSSHQNWLREKLADGWKYGPVKDVDKKEHPCCVEFSTLPVDQQRKDYIFSYIVYAFFDADRQNSKGETAAA